MDPQHIIDICELNWDANKSDCNHFVKAVADALGLTLLNSNDTSDIILGKLSNASGWSLIPSTPDLSTVETDATVGQFIVAGLRSNEFTPPRRHGHVVVVVKGDDSLHPGYPLAYWGTLGGVGQKNSSIRNTFIPDIDLPNVKYYGIALPDAATMRFNAQVAGLSGPGNLTEVNSTINNIVTTLVSSLDKGSGANPKEQTFFPNGIERVEIQVKVGTIDVSVKVVGPQAT